MKRRSKYTITSLLAALLLTVTLGGCSPEVVLEGDEATDADGELVKVPLTLGVLPLEQPGAATKVLQAQTSTGERIIASERTNGMLVELVETPDETATRTVNEDDIYNIWVFQFNGTANSAVLVKKEYFVKYTAGMAMDLIKGNNQRVVVLVNTFDKSLVNSFTIGSSTYQNLLDASRTIKSESDLFTYSGAYLPMSGAYVGTLDKDMKINIDIRRNVAKVAVSVKNGNLVSPVADTWHIQMCNVPSLSYYYIDASGDKFPADGLAVMNYPKTTLPVMSTTDFVLAGEWYVPINKRGLVSGVTSAERATKAPSESTYLRISGSTSNGDYYFYTIHLGENFTNSYNLVHNNKYTYRVRLYDGDYDSRLDVEKGLSFMGRLGGDLVKNENGEWQYTDNLFVPSVDHSASSQWGGAENLTSGGDKFDGRGITLEMAGKNYAAGLVCWQKNGGISPATTSKYDPAYKWFMPALQELFAVWVCKNSYTGSNFPSQQYWAASQSGGNASWAVDFATGHATTYQRTEFKRVRCLTNR